MKTKTNGVMRAYLLDPKMLGNRRHQRILQLSFEWMRRHQPEQLLKLRGKARRQVERQEAARG